MCTACCCFVTLYIELSYKSCRKTASGGQTASQETQFGAKWTQTGGRSTGRVVVQIYTKENRHEMHLWDYISHVWTNRKLVQVESQEDSAGHTVLHNATCFIQALLLSTTCRVLSSPQPNFPLKQKTTIPLFYDGEANTQELLGGFSIHGLSDRTCFCLRAVTWLPVLPGNVLFTETTEQNVTRLRASVFILHVLNWHCYWQLQEQQEHFICSSS